MTEITYRQNGDYLIPDIGLPEQPDTPLGKYGRMRKTYLKEHRPVLWNRVVLEGKLYPHLREIDQAANSRLEQMLPKLAESAGATGTLKVNDLLRWAANGSHRFLLFTSVRFCFAGE